MKLLLTGAYKYNEAQLERISQLGFDLLFIEDDSAPTKVDLSEIEALICNRFLIHNDLSHFKNLKFIQLLSAGLDRVPLDLIKTRGIKLANARGVYSAPMAEWVVLKILEIYKQSRHFYQAQNERRWSKKRDLLELEDKTALIIGFGHIGQEIARRLKPFNVKLLAVDIRQLDQAESELTEGFYSLAEVEEALSVSDIVILTLPLTEQSRHLVDQQKLALIKEQAVLINISRGAIIDEQALIDALEKGRFLGVALDVFEEEPLPDTSPLWGFERVIITPHNSFVSDQVHERLYQLIYNNLEHLLKVK